MPAETTSAGSPHEAAVVARARQRLAARARAVRKGGKVDADEEAEGDGGEAAQVQLPEPQLVLARFPDGSEGQRFARLDPGLRAVGVRELKRSGPERKVEVGKETLFALESVASLKYQNRTVLLMGPGDALVLWLQLDTPQEAQAWKKGIEMLMEQSAEESKGSPEADGSSSSHGPQAGNGAEDPAAWRSARAREVKRLKALCAAHESRIESLADSNQRKQSQVLRMQAKLEEALSILQAGQATYSRQQQVLDEQQAMVQELKRRKGYDVESPKNEEENEKPVPVTSSEDEDDDDEEENEDESITALLDLARRADILQQQVREAGASNSSTGRPDAEGLDRAGATASQVLNSAPALLAHLQALKAEKDQLQSSLESEQAALEEELRSLQAQMS